MQRQSRSRALAFAWVAAVAVALGCVGSPVVAAASCPRLVSGAPETFLDKIAHFAASAERLSDTQKWEAFTNGTITIPPFYLAPLNGPAPLMVFGRWFWAPIENPLRVEFDADSDGRPEVSGSEYDQVRHTYPGPGRFTATASVRDHQGRVRTHTVVVTVVPFADFDADLQARWTTLKAALRAGKVDAAVECLHSGKRSSYRDLFRKLFASAPRDVDKIMTSIRFIEQQPGRAVYEMLRPRDGTMYSYQVLFAIDEDGVWRIFSF